jgi:hypothetical protein
MEVGGPNDHNPAASALIEYSYMERCSRRGSVQRGDARRSEAPICLRRFKDAGRTCFLEMDRRQQASVCNQRSPAQFECKAPSLPPSNSIQLLTCAISSRWEKS